MTAPVGQAVPGDQGPRGPCSVLHPRVSRSRKAVHPAESFADLFFRDVRVVLSEVLEDVNREVVHVMRAALSAEDGPEP